jgi:hypothetical protein
MITQKSKTGSSGKRFTCPPNISRNLFFSTISAGERGEASTHRSKSLTVTMGYTSGRPFPFSEKIFGYRLRQDLP